VTERTFHLIHHTHWDREWYLPRTAFQVQLGDAVGDLLDLLERDDTARFVLDGQSILVDDTVALYPAWRSRFARAVRAGQLDIGPWYILADEQIPSAESLVRNLLYGAADSAALGGRMDVLYSPDAFGHPGVLPALAREFGINAAVIWRGHGDDRVDRDLYWWRSPDGPDVLLYHLPRSGYEIGADLVDDTPDFAARWRTIRTVVVDRSTTPHVAVFVGTDHHAPIRHPARLADCIRELEPGNVVRWSTLGEFMTAVAGVHAALPAVTGELRASEGHTWALQGVHGTRMRMKRRHGMTELALQRRAEALGALATRHGMTSAGAVLSLAWRTLLQCQFHDTLCGCSSDSVAREQDVRLTSVQAVERHITRAALHTLVHHDADRARARTTDSPHLVIWNPAARGRHGIVVAEVTMFRSDVLVGPPSDRRPRIGAGYQPFTLRGPDGTAVAVQVLDVHPGRERIDARRHYPDEDVVDRVQVACFAPPIGGLALTVLPLSLGPDRALPLRSHLEATERRLANQFIEVHVGGDGRIDMLDRRSGERFADVIQLIDEADHGDSYTPWTPPNPARATITWSAPAVLLAAGPLLAALRIEFRATASGTLRVAGSLTVTLHADSAAVRVRIDVDNRARNHRLRIRTPVGAGTDVTAGAAFGYERRGVGRTASVAYPREMPVATAPAHRYVAAGDHDRALVLLVPAFVEYEWTADRELMHTVFRATGDLARDDLPTRPGTAAWTTSIPEAQELGPHVHEFALMSTDQVTLERPDACDTLWEDVFLPLQPTFIRDYVGVDASAYESAGIELVGDGLVFAALKCPENGDGLVLRCYNTEPASVDGQWRCTVPIVQARLLRADESTIEPLYVAEQRDVQFTVPARGISTVWIKLVDA
jgi:alpha-mannosidase